MAEFDPTPSMYYVYVLRGVKDKEFYCGYTGNLKKRFKEHNKNKNYELLYYEAYKTKKDAYNRERQLKHHAQALTALKVRLKESLKL
ncbi:MAG: GIY-YIG nuclease family protein [Candidatus Omnitrophota bacterium]